MTPSFPALSVLDLIAVRQGQTSAEAINSSLALAQTADDLGYARYWFAEHHNMPSVASTNPPVLIAAAAARTSRIRVGSGGVMLPNHAPLVVAEQFAALEAMSPGRIDLGIGRAPGSDPVVTHLLRQSGPTSDVDRFPEHVQTILAMTSPEGASISFTSGGTYQVNATPAATSTPQVWLLGSSDYSAQLAAALGLPYVFANHFSGSGLDRALDLYRTQFSPSEAFPEPVTFLTVNVVAAETAEEAEARALPQLRQFACLRLNRPLGPIETVDAIQAAGPDDDLTRVAQSIRPNWFVGTGSEVRTSLADFAARYGVDEVMVVPMAGAYADEATSTSPGRVTTLELLAK